MNIETLAVMVVDACEEAGAEHMLTGAFAYGAYAIPRSTKDVDVVVAVQSPQTIGSIIEILADRVEFGGQVQFDTLTWGRRHVGRAIGQTHYQVELFELFDDPFVMAQFERRRQLRSPQLGRLVWIPSPEDVVVQKLRWARAKDLDDALDVLAVQRPEKLDMAYIRSWCEKHDSVARLDDALVKVESI